MYLLHFKHKEIIVQIENKNFYDSLCPYDAARCIFQSSSNSRIDDFLLFRKSFLNIDVFSMTDFRSKLRRAKAVVDFERHEDDELGFRKHDIITVRLLFFVELLLLLFISSSYTIPIRYTIPIT